jgi:hypothetical protein
MKFTVSFKTPDALDWPLEEMPEEDREKAENFAAKWIEYGEEVNIEFDTVKKTATVLPVSG